MGASPVIPFVLNAIFVFLGALLNLYYLNIYIDNFSGIKLLLNGIIPSVLSGIIGLFIIYVLTANFNPSIIKLITMYVISTLVFALLSYSFLFDRELRKIILMKFLKVK